MYRSDSLQTEHPSDSPRSPPGTARPSAQPAGPKCSADVLNDFAQEAVQIAKFQAVSIGILDCIQRMVKDIDVHCILLRSLTKQHLDAHPCETPTGTGDTLHTPQFPAAGAYTL